MNRLALTFVLMVLFLSREAPISYANINMSMGIYGSDATSLSVSADSSKGNTQNVTHTNAGISGGTITINTADKTTIAGANIHAADKLTLNCPVQVSNGRKP